MVTEIALDMCAGDGKDRVPIVIKADPKNNFMWFSTADGHSICRIDTVIFNRDYAPTQSENDDGKCVCSPGCKTMNKSNDLEKAKFNYPIIEFPIPKVYPNMLLSGLALSQNGDEIWTQSFVDGTDDKNESSD